MIRMCRRQRKITQNLRRSKFFVVGDIALPHFCNSHFYPYCLSVIENYSFSTTIAVIEEGRAHQSDSMKRKSIAQERKIKVRYKGERHKNFHPIGLYLNLFFISGDSNIALFGIEELLSLILDYIGRFNYISSVWCLNSHALDERRTTLISIHSTELQAMIAALQPFKDEYDEYIFRIKNPSSD